MKQWYAIRSKPRREAWVAGLLTRADLEVYLPEVAIRQPGKPPVREPFFPGYLFGRLDSHVGDLHMVRYTPGVLHIVGYGDQPYPVPDSVVLALRDRIARIQGTRPGADFKHGERVVISSGPLAEMEAIFDRRLTASGRARVLIQLLHRVCRTEVDVRQLRRAQAAGRVAA